ncbi:related to sensory transduction histidine kinase [Rhynchosporium secalis]|uniref:Related to sensory transduction histidine kinase n=1 Tax=Rhynchosporium secalis TaxID=38038 RepID=A0A1E1MCX0_RHYSE|nr:related to sensory transduction histidine kinase [Rhynchosporium secalis]
MNPEAKSIFTSKKDFTATQPDRDRVSPLTNLALTFATSTLNPSVKEETQQVGPEADPLIPGRRVFLGEAAPARGRLLFGTVAEASVEVNVHDGTLPAILPNIAASRRISYPPSHRTTLFPPAPPHASKHPRGGSRPASTEPPQKRNQPAYIKTRHHTLDSESLQSTISTPSDSPPSPLFFSSHQSKKRPYLPPKLSSSDTASTMLNKTRDESGGVTTLKIARGSLSTSSPPRASSTPGVLASAECKDVTRSSVVKLKHSVGMQTLESVGVVELLEQDERPTFILDLADPSNFTPGSPLQLLFSNAALKAHGPVLDMVVGQADLDSPGVAVINDFPEFKAWALSFVKNGESLDVCLPSMKYAGFTWNCSTLRKRLRLISGSSNTSIVAIPPGSNSNGAPSSSSTVSERLRGTITTRLAQSPLVRSTEPGDYFGDAASITRSPISFPSQHDISDLVSPSAELENGPPKQAMLAHQSEALTNELMRSRYPDNPCFDWTRIPLSAALPKHVQFARSIDWASTALGPMEDWSFDLRAMCNLIMGSPHPAAMYWGDEYIAIYNEAYILLAGQKHPQLMGQSYKVAWAEIWSEIEGVFDNGRYSGQSTMKDDDCLFLKRNGYLEESYFSWSIVPLIGDDGSVVGLYNPAFEKTRRKIAERRMLTLREVGEKTANAREVKSFWGQVLKGLEYNEYDVPFAFLYSVSEESDNDLGSMHSGSLAQTPLCTLEGTLGVPPDHRAVASPLDLKASDESFAPYLRESMRYNKTILLTTEDGTLSSDLIQGLEWRGFGDPCRAAVVCPIHPTTGETILGFLVMGINPRRPYDDDYSLFIQLLGRQLATSMASVVLFEEEIRRGQRAAQLAALDRQELSKQLDLRTKEAVESETRFTRMAEFAPVGMFIADGSGAITYSNDTWWEISRHPRGVNSANTWMDSIKDEDREGVEFIWKKLVHKKTAVTHEFRFKTPWQDRNGNRSDTWVLMSAYPERDPDGKLKSVFGSITNISQQKLAEDFQKRRMEEAIEMKRQQENFIDMTSHEMRNPLSAILQCSDEITSSLMEFRAAEEGSRSPLKLLETLENSIDASQTIALCAQHQKRIVDDILTLSKLDSALLVVTPVAVQPVAVVQRALKMFEGELESNDIAMEFRMEKSYMDLGIDWVKLDPSRLLQVLINLTTNAIKFTHGQEKRTIVVSVGASLERPGGNESDVSYFPTRSKRKNMVTEDPEWGTGDEIHLHFAVQDTGRGLDAKEKTLLFQRFSQASPRTHVQYGGSGLGLFISRELTELQGGEIGVSSERGVGSTFAFYIKARKLEGFAEDTPLSTTISSLRKSSSNAAVTIESKKNSSGDAVHRSHTTGSRQRSTMTPPATSPQPQPANDVRMDHAKIRILIVEDNLVNQKVLQKSLKNQGFITELANHGGEALEFIKTTSFWKGREEDGVELAVVLMDLEMPIMDGLTCTRTIRDLEVDGTIVKHIPIIAVTANARLEQIETALTAGMDNVVSKPFRMPELIPKVYELVAKSKSAVDSSTNVDTEESDVPPL